MRVRTASGSLSTAEPAEDVPAQEVKQTLKDKVRAYRGRN